MNTQRQSGFSLLEMALSLSVLGFLFAMLPMTLSLLDSVQSAAPSLDQNKLAVNASVGFIVQHDRLPCPDANGDGLENCNGTRRGRYPYRTVGLGKPLVNDSGYPYVYAVYQHSIANLTALQSSYQPKLLSGEVSTATNALDFCQGLRLGLSGGLQSGEASVLALGGSAGVNPAFLFVDPGSADRNANGQPLDGNNVAGLVFESVGRSDSDNYDDTVTAISFAELSARLDCPHIIASVSAAARDANAAYDAWRAYQFYLDFRLFGESVRETSLDMAELKRTIALFNSAAGTAMALNDLATGLASATGAAAIAVASVNAAIAAAMIVTELQSSAEDVAGKKDELATAVQQRNAAEVARNAALAYRQKASALVLSRDAKGWFQ
ncbi:type II secretion system protein [Pseudomonas neustonica]|uniref:Type II secretion system protein n=1 Tax=Pseudomonas neustonica TaxID=2487346 RepID=A0ABX9XJK8_9PSED|nr:MULTISPECIES: type II secretion system protein [Pseudomonas]ROZ84515.1 type II secretion system protein [Pseudomonas sp. SSM44]ROZ86318.1 type II secretion system protein [Pseudomonas neustonica]|tara:strand:- start:4833 stop:5975 length:1143 start_codon:yes stop_codon:yes gene_type:complete